MSSEKGQNIFMPKKINCFSINITLEGIEKIKTSKKMTTKQFEEYFFHQRWKETSTNIVIPFRF